MNRILATICCLTFFFSASAQFNWSNPQPSGFLNNKVVFVNDSTGFIINTNGDLLKTANRGVTWNNSNYFPRCSAMDAKDSFLVIGGADTTVYISIDGANSWIKGVIKQDNVIDKIQIINKDTVFALCKNSNIGTAILYRSTDGALTWQSVTVTPNIRTFDFIDGKLGYATSYGTVFKTVNGGLAWDTIYNAPSGYGFLAMEFLDRNLGFAYKEFDGIFRTTDGGSTWSRVLASTYGRIYNFGFASTTTVFAVGEDGSLYRSTDGGTNWEFKYNHTGDRFGIYSCFFTSATTGYFAGLRGVIFKTIDGGNSYMDYSPFYNDVRPISFPTPSVGYAGVWWNLYKTTNGGQSWAKLPIITDDTSNQRFTYLHFYSADSGLAFAESPVRMYKTTNGGLNWQPVDLPIPYYQTEYISGFFTIKNTIYINLKAAYGNYMLQSMDRGETWRTLYQSQYGTVRNLFFVDEQTGYGTLGPYLYKTIDSAKTWTTILTSSGYAYSSLWFVNPAVGYLGGSGGANYRTLDSGKTWQFMYVYPDNANFYDVFAIRFFNEKIGYLTSGYGGIYKTFNGGKNWKPDMGATWDCHTIEMTTDTTLFIGGDYGTLLSKDMREYDIDSLSASLEPTCNARITAIVSAALSRVDSIWVEYGAGGKFRSVQSNPLSVRDSTVKADILLQGLSSDSIYRVRIKLFYRNSYYYSDSINFRPGGLPKPVITLNGTTLSSSTPSGNQWFLDGNPITGATNATYQPVTGGTYTVQQTQNGCKSSMSQGLNYTATAIIDPVLAESIQILPNPVRSILRIKNKGLKKLRLTMVDIGGRIIEVVQTSKAEELWNVDSLSAGIYTLLIEDLTTHRRTTAKLVKW